MTNVIYLPQWMQIIEVIEKYDKQSVSDVNKKLELTYTHTFNIITALEKRGFLRSQIIGRSRIITLSSAGKRVAASIKLLKEVY